MSDTGTMIEPVAAWDTRSPCSLSPAEWRARNDTSLMRKVSVIVAAARDPSSLPREELPTNHKQLRAWSDPERRLWSWSGREVDDKKGRNKEVVARLHNAWRALADANASRKAKPRQSPLREQLAAALEQNDALHAQLVRLMRERNGRNSVSEEERR